MAYLQLSDLSTHIYQEITNEIIRSDATIADRAIAAALGEVQCYLTKFDLVALFGTTATDGAYTEPTFSDEYLKTIVKDVACWYILKLANPNIDMALFRSAYEDAIKFLINIQKGLVDPPYPPNPDLIAPNGEDESGGVSWSSAHKRRNYY